MMFSFLKNKNIEFYLFNLLVVIAIAVAINAFFKALSWNGKTFPGFLLYNPVIVSDVSLSDWHQSQGYNIRSYDKILAVNDIKVETAKDVYKIVSSYPPGTPIKYTIARRSDIFELTLPSMEFESNYVVEIFGVEFFVGFAFLLLCFTVFNLRQTQLDSKVFFGLCFSLAIWFIEDFDYQTTYSLFYYTNWQFLAQLLTPAFLVLFAFVFPQTSCLYLKRKKLFLIPFILSVFVFLSQLFLINADYLLWDRVYFFSYLYVFVGTLTLVYSLFLTYRNPISVVEKEKARVVLFGVMFGFMVPALLAVIFAVFRISNLHSLVILLLAFPLSIAYAIVKHKLFDINIIVKRTLVYGLTTAVIAGFFILLFFLFSLILSPEAGANTSAYLLLLSIVAVIAVNPLKNFIQKSVDTIFSRDNYDYETLVSKYTHVLSSLLKVKNIASHLMNTISKAFPVKSALLYVVDKNSGLYKVIGSIPHRTTRDVKEEIKPDEYNILIKVLYEERKEIFREDIISLEKYESNRAELLDIFSEFKASIVFPLFFKGDLLGILFIGEKESEQAYTTKDVKFLSTIVDQVAIAIENSFSFEVIESYAKELEEKNKILKDIQQQLIHTEKMSAIGYLAAGIAHEIRNPLNIIEGARYYLSTRLADLQGDDSIQEYLEYIQGEIIRTNRLIDQLLNFSKESQTKFESLDVNNLVDNVLVLSRKQIDDANITLTKSFAERLPTVYADSGQLWQVIVNILINAIQAMDDGGEIAIETGVIGELNGSGNSYVYIKFRDNGCGVKEEDLPRIFDPFFTNKPEGTGLGLSISYKIIESFKGSILASSKVGKGSIFIIQIPINGEHNGRAREEKNTGS